MSEQHDIVTIEEKIEDVLENIRPSITQHAGDVRLFSFSDGIVRIEMKGACVGCPMASMTLKMGIEKNLQEAIPEVKRVVQVDAEGKDVIPEWDNPLPTSDI